MSSKARIKSAGPSQNRTSHEVLYLRDQITKLEHELMASRAEVQKVNERLNCLVTLVKQAWSGNDESAIHVANIVGMAPPDFVNNHDPDQMTVTYTTKPKSRSVSNWALLTIGLLNREYKRLEREIEEKQTQHLMHRQAYLDEQLLYTRDLSLRQRRGSAPAAGRPVAMADNQRIVNGNQNDGTFLTQPQTTPAAEGRRVKSAVQRPSSGVQSKKPAVRHLYRPVNERRAESGIKFNDLFVDSSHQLNRDMASTMDGLYRLPKHRNENGVSDQPENNLAYDDPRRYTQMGVFNAQDVFGPETKSRPPSGVQQRNNDFRRALPKFNGTEVPKAERPLRYETTRPVSAKTPTSNTKNSKNVTKPSSAQKTQLRTQSLTDLYNAARNVETIEERDAASPPPPIQVMIEQPDSVKQFAGDLSNLKQMQDDYMKATIDLQKKLGISPKAMIY